MRNIIYVLSFDNFKNVKYACAVYKVLHGLAPPPLSEYIKLKANSGTTTRAATRGDCEVPYRRTSFGQTVLSVKGRTSGTIYHLQYVNAPLTLLSKPISSDGSKPTKIAATAR